MPTLNKNTTCDAHTAGAAREDTSLQAHRRLQSQATQRMADFDVSLIGELARMAAPELCRIWPAMTIVALAPHFKSHQGRMNVPKGRVVALGVGEPKALFTTSHDIDLLPSQPPKLNIERLSPGRARLTIMLTPLLGHSLGDIFAGKLRFYIDGELKLAQALWAALRYAAQRAYLQVGAYPLGSAADVSCEPFAAEAICPIDDNDAQALGAQLLTERMHLPHSTLFFDVLPPKEWQDRACAREAELEGEDVTASVTITIDHAEPLPEDISEVSLRLDCVAACNVFAAAAKPVLVGPLSSEHLLRVDGYDIDSTEIYQVKRVTAAFATAGVGQAKQQPSVVEILPWDVALGVHCQNQSPQSGIEPLMTVGYQLTSTPRQTPKLGHTTHIRFAWPAGCGLDLSCPNAVASIDVLCSQGALASALAPGTAGRVLNFVGCTQATNVVATTLSKDAHVDATMATDLLAELFKTRCESRLQLLKRIGTLSRTALPASDAARRFSRFMGAIENFDCRWMTAFVAHALIGVLQITITLNGRASVTLAEACFFAELLVLLLADDQRLGEARQVVCLVLPTHRRLSWPITTGACTLEAPGQPTQASRWPQNTASLF